MLTTAHSRRHTPYRTCIVCGHKTPKGELLRVVRTLQGHIEMDPTGRMPGRGGYICKSETCGSKPLTRNRLEYTLHGKIDDASLRELSLVLGTLTTPDSS